jgi:hypothetical protein
MENEEGRIVKFIQYTSLKLNSNMKGILIILIILNSIVFLGQVWPEGAPPFAGPVNIIFLLANLVFLIWFVSKRRQ